MDTKDITYLESGLDDIKLFERLPQGLKDFLSRQNGCIIFGGGLHIRGACKSPDWHSLREAWLGKYAFHQFYEKIEKGDIPFAQGCMGDQFFLRGQKVLKLNAEDGDTRLLQITFEEFLVAAEKTPVEFLGLQPLFQFTAEGKTLAPGQLLFAYPPFCALEASSGVQLSAVPAGELLLFHIELSR